MIFGIVSIPLLFAMAMGIDYATNARRWTQLNVAADAAALAAVTQQMLSQPDDVAANAARDMFIGQTTGMNNLQFNPATDLSIAIADHVDTQHFTGFTRTATVSYTALASNIFSGLLGQPGMTLSGSHQATGSQPPNVNFYLLLDSSPSMGIAGTVAGFQQMIAATPAQGGCAFACHEKYPPVCPTETDVCGNPHGAPGTPYAKGVDNYMLAKNYLNPPVVLRIDLVNSAVQALLQFAQQAEQGLQSYQVSINTFDVAVNPVGAQTIGALTPDLNSLAQQLSVNPIQQFEVYDHDSATGAANVANGDMDWPDAIATMNAVMPDPGNGTNLPGDKPLGVLFIVTDGVQDLNGGPHTEVPALMSPATCTAIKNRNIRIAILYTEYLPMPTSASYIKYVAPFQGQIASNLASCASLGLFSTVTQNQDISAALVALFQATLAARSYLSQ